PSFPPSALVDGFVEPDAQCTTLPQRGGPFPWRVWYVPVGPLVRSLEIGCVVSKAANNRGQLSDLAAVGRRRGPRRTTCRAGRRNSSCRESSRMWDRAATNRRSSANQSDHRLPLVLMSFASTGLHCHLGNTRFRSRYRSKTFKPCAAPTALAELWKF